MVDNSQLSPLVQVKYNCDYDYDNQKFHLVEGETLFLISKSNQDWWLCLRLADKLTFFVPATYVKEIECMGPPRSRLQPPPRPPPPPPPAPVTRTSRTSTDDLDAVPSPKPQVKKRQNAPLASTSSRATNSVESVQSVYENLAESGSGPSRRVREQHGNENHGDDEMMNSNEYGGLNPDAIISDLDDRLNREEESFVNRIVENAASAITNSSGVFGIVDSTVSKSVLPSASIDADYVRE